MYVQGLYLTPRECSVLAPYLRSAVVRARERNDCDLMAIVDEVDAIRRAWAASISADGNSELPTRDEIDDSWDAGHTGVSTSEAGERLGVTPRQVVNLIKEKKLSGTKLRGSWDITIESLERERERRGTGRPDAVLRAA